jgi:hypothetical protein
MIMFICNLLAHPILNGHTSPTVRNGRDGVSWAMENPYMVSFRNIRWQCRKLYKMTWNGYIEDVLLSRRGGCQGIPMPGIRRNIFTILDVNDAD